VNNPLVSIIIPFYNRFVYLERSMQSVINQTYDNWEIILIDDCSVEKFNLNPDYGYKIKLLRNENNLGPGLSRQLGVENAKGKLLCFLDSDDYYESEFLEKSVNVHLQNSEISASYCTSIYVDGIIRERSDISFNDLVTPLLYGKRPWATCSLVWKRNFIAKWTSLRTNQDYLFEFQSALINNKILHIPEILSVVNKNTGQNSDDLVSYKSILINKNIVLCFAFLNIKNYQDLNLSKVDTYQLALMGLKEQILKSIELYSYSECKKIINALSTVFSVKNSYVLFFTVLLPRKKLRRLFAKFTIDNIIKFNFINLNI
jgi:glycosyltransferase involved in cell wall biosynthesis